MNVITKTLSGAEISVAIGGQNTEIRNDGAATVYASADEGIVAGADGVVAIHAGEAVTVLDTRGKVYLLGTGEVSVVGKDTVSAVFKCAPTAGGSGQDDVARQAIAAHEGNAVVHVTAAEKSAWNAVNYSNPNLLINPDFRINQRGQAEYTDNMKYTVDRWMLELGSTTEASAPKVDVTDNGITISAVGCNAYLSTVIEIAPLGKTVTYSVSANGSVYSKTVTLPDETPETDNTLLGIISAPNEGRIADIYMNSNGAIKVNVSARDGKTNHFEWAKLEFGSIATPFCPPDPATELAKCERYFYRTPASGTFGVGFIGGASYATVNINLPTTMRINPTITMNGTLSLATAGHNGSGGVIKVTSTIPGGMSTPNTATLVFDISSTNDASITGYCCLLQNRYDGYIYISAEL